MVRDKDEIELCWKALENKMEELQFTRGEKEQVKKKLLHEEANKMRQRRRKLTADDFEPVAIIGRGAFGEVRVCRKKDTGEIVAIKKMKKEEMIYKNQVGHVRAERNVLAHADIP